MTSSQASKLEAVRRALVFSLDLAETIQPLVPEAEQIRQKLIAELKERGQRARRIYATDTDLKKIL